MLVYIYDILIITKGNYEQHSQAVKKVLTKLKEVGMHLNIDESYFAKSSVNYLHYIISREDIKLQSSKVNIIVSLPRPKTAIQVKQFAGMINFYRDIWKGYAHHMLHIMNLVKNKKKGQLYSH